jgi:hypothetical protein
MVIVLEVRKISSEKEIIAVKVVGISAPSRRIVLLKAGGSMLVKAT